MATEVKIPNGWRKLNEGEIPKIGDKEWRLNKKRDGFGWFVLNKADELDFPVNNAEIIIREEI